MYNPMIVTKTAFSHTSTSLNKMKIRKKMCDQKDAHIGRSLLLPPDAAQLSLASILPFFCQQQSLILSTPIVKCSLNARTIHWLSKMRAPQHARVLPAPQKRLGPAGRLCFVTSYCCTYGIGASEQLTEHCWAPSKHSTEPLTAIASLTQQANKLLTQ